MHIEPLAQQHKTFLLGLSISLLILVSFFGGVIADRLFVIKPLDVVLGKRSLPKMSSTGNGSGADLSPLTSLVISSGLNDVSEIAEQAAESVVTISIRTQRRVVELGSGGIFGQIGFPSGGTERIESVQRDIGTGFVVEGGFIITNRHVVSEPGAEYKVIDKYDQEHVVTNIYRDPSNDLAIMEIEGGGLSSLGLGNSDQLKVGQGVVAIGTALGEFRHTVTTGVISGLERGLAATNGLGFESLEGVIQTDAAINPGNSGGPLIDLSGQVIGVNAAVSAGAQNIGFAIPINVVRATIENFNETGQFDRPFLGVKFRVISEQAATFNKIQPGVLVTEVIEGSSADVAGLQSGDIVTKFGGVDVEGEDANLGMLINQHKIGDKIEVVFSREGKSHSVMLVLRGQ
jgi:serine protease Do